MRNIQARHIWLGLLFCLGVAISAERVIATKPNGQEALSPIEALERDIIQLRKEVLVIDARLRRQGKLEPEALTRRLLQQRLAVLLKRARQLEGQRARGFKQTIEDLLERFPKE